MERSVHVCVIFLVMGPVSLGQGPAPTCQNPSGYCKCKTDQGTVDLAPVSASGQTPVYNRVFSPNDNNHYDYDPCNAFSVGSNNCRDVLVCQETGDNTFGIGSPSSVTWGNDPDSDNALMISYNTTDAQGTTRKTYVTLLCNPDEVPGSLVAPGEIPGHLGQFKLILTSAYACPSVGGGGLSPGSILCIILVGVLVVYVLGGMAYMRLGRGAQGAEMVPHISFWKELPSLIKEGGQFVFGGIKRTVTGRSSGYDQV